MTAGHPANSRSPRASDYSPATKLGEGFWICLTRMQRGSGGGRGEKRSFIYFVNIYIVCIYIYFIHIYIYSRCISLSLLAHFCIIHCMFAVISLCYMKVFHTTHMILLHIVLHYFVSYHFVVHKITSNYFLLFYIALNYLILSFIILYYNTISILYIYIYLFLNVFCCIRLSSIRSNYMLVLHLVVSDIY